MRAVVCGGATFLTVVLLVASVPNGLLHSVPNWGMTAHPAIYALLAIAWRPA